jgi:hypothetical protein
LYFKSWGIVAVAAIGHVDCVTWISTFTIEGELIQEVQMRRPISVMRSFASAAEFDWFVIVDVGGVVFVTDTVELEVTDPIRRILWAVIAVGATREHGIVLVDEICQVVRLDREWN